VRPRLQPPPAFFKLLSEFRTFGTARVLSRRPRRMESSANGPGVERSPDSAPTNATTTPYLFGAICPARGVEAAMALPYADTDMMQLHLDEISRNVAEGADAILLLDRAGWHTTGKLDVLENITPIFLPSRAPELNPVENIWQYLRQTWLSRAPSSRTTTPS
jgi:DDE superfamily endonuclease